MYNNNQVEKPNPYRHCSNLDRKASTGEVKDDNVMTSEPMPNPWAARPAAPLMILPPPRSAHRVIPDERIIGRLVETVVNNARGRKVIGKSKANVLNVGRRIRVPKNSRNSSKGEESTSKRRRLVKNDARLKDDSNVKDDSRLKDDAPFIRKVPSLVSAARIAVRKAGLARSLFGGHDETLEVIEETSRQPLETITRPHDLNPVSLTPVVAVSKESLIARIVKNRHLLGGLQKKASRLDESDGKETREDVGKDNVVADKSNDPVNNEIDTVSCYRTNACNDCLLILYVAYFRPSIQFRITY